MDKNIFSLILAAIICLSVIWIFGMLTGQREVIVYQELEPCSLDNFTTGQTYIVSGNNMTLEEANEYQDGDVRLYFAPIAE